MPKTPLLDSIYDSVEFFQFGSLVINLKARAVSVFGQPITLTRLEFDVLIFLAYFAGQAVSDAELLYHVWRCSEGGTAKQVKNCIYRLRQKIELNPQNPKFVHRLRGKGYVMPKQTT